MDDFGMLAKDFGFRPQGKSAPMKSSGGDRRSRHSPSSATLSADGNGLYNDVFGGPPKYTNNNANSKSTSSMSDFDYDSIFKDSVSANNNEAKTKPTSSNSPVYDKPVYDDDVFDGLPGIKSKPISSSSSSGRYDDNIFASMTSSPPKPSPLTDHFDDLFSNLGRTEKAQPSKHQYDQSPRGFDRLIPGFGSGSPASGTRWNSDPSPKSANKTKEKSNPLDDPFSVLESISTPVTSSRTLFTDPLEEITKIGKSNTRKPSSSTDMFNDIDSLNNFNKSSPPSTKDRNNRGKTQTHSEEGSSIGSAGSSVSRDPIEESNQSIFDMPTVSRTCPTSSQAGPSPKSEEKSDIWLTVSEIPLFTSVTRAPPPSRPPPPIPTQVDREEEMIREKERMREIERQAVERATKEARERAANEARVKSERAAVQRAQAEARERAAVEAKRAAVEKAAVAKAQAEARRRAERAAVEKVTAEARQRAAAEARDRAAAAKAKQQTNDNDLDSFFNSRPNSVPKSRTASDSAASDTLSRAPEAATHRPCSSGGASSNVRKASPTPNFVDDLTSVFGGTTTTTMAAGEFQDFEGETDDRRRARLEREQRAQERAAKALAEKNERDMQSQKEQEERHRISTTLDVEIKRWAAGKEGNLRAMLSTLQYVLWPECGWQAISLTDLITGASVKKAYRKATLCIHPDKVQQKGANLQQKYVAEKVFDLLKEAWNKFNSEELF